MGYDLHITRKAHWADESGPVITEAEWRGVIAADPELDVDTDTTCTMADGEYVFAAWDGRPGALGYYGGEMTAKHPDGALIAKMVRIATTLGAVVQGDDGEVYREDGTSFDREPDGPTPVRGGVLSRLAGWFRRRRTAQEVRTSRDAAPAFRPGQRVKNHWGQLGTVQRVDKNANGGLGSVHVRFDDGREEHAAYVASGYEIVGVSTSG